MIRYGMLQPESPIQHQQGKPMQIQTHLKIDQSLCGQPISVENGCCRIELTTTEKMAVDLHGLVHGGFIFGLADYAAMVAVNHPNVVLGAAEVRFLKPVRVGEKVVANARVEANGGKKHQVEVRVDRDGEQVFQGSFTCFILAHHVLNPSR
jgi:uncharacterized protein (TIGR00369 family)